MMKKGFLVLIAAASFLFFSCGSTKQETQTPEVSEPVLETEDVQTTEAEEVLITDTDKESVIKSESTDEEADSSVDNEQLIQEQDVHTLEDSAELNDIDLLYPPLDEIEEPDLIDVSPEEIEEQANAEKTAEKEENQITEPVVEEEALPPLPMTETEDNAETDEALRQAQGPQNSTEGTLDDETGTGVSEALEGQENLEPTIEIQTAEEAETEPQILPSRSVSLKKGETLVITYPGNGWIYMGSTSEYNNLASRGRKLGTTDTKYTLLAKEAGTQIHHFYKVDNLTGEYIDDYIEVTVLEKKGNSSTVVNAPDYSEVVPKKPEVPAKATSKTATTTQKENKETEKEETSSKQASETLKQTTTTGTSTEEKTLQTKDENTVIEIENEDTVIIIDEEESEEAVDLKPLLEKARSSVSSKNFEDAYPALVQYLEFSTDNRDEALYLLGQVLESDSKYRDIKQAVETYQTLCNSYPASAYWEPANKRIVYLKRFYINIH
ncbi:MAG: hypothetical protein J5710_06585 [Treponema sp.]|nr:hypothetical protein [Treponema sp.]